jgi:hypothetical protein
MNFRFLVCPPELLVAWMGDTALIESSPEPLHAHQELLYALQTT